MKQLLLWLGFIPAWVKKNSPVILGITGNVMKGLNTASLIAELTPTDVDDALIVALRVQLSTLNEILQQVGHDGTKKALVLRMGAEILSKIDGDKERMGYYIILMEIIYQRSIK